MSLPLVPQDKANHIVYGFFLYFLCLVFFKILSIVPIFKDTFFMTVFTWKFLPLIIVSAVAIGKESYDKITKKGTPEILDSVCTILSALIMLLSKNL